MSQNETSGTVAVDNQKIKNKTDGAHCPDDCSNLRPRTTFHPAAIQPCSDLPYKLCNLSCNLCSRNAKTEQSALSSTSCSEQLVSRSSPLSVEVSRFSQDQPEDI